MTKYFKLLFQDESIEMGVARTSDPALFFLPEGEIAAWQPITLQLTDGGFADYLANDMGVRLCSPKMRAVLEAAGGPGDVVRWLAVHVEYALGDSREYWILHFPSPFDVVHREQSILAGDFVAKLVLRNDRLTDRHVFSYPGGGGLPLIVTDRVKAALERAGCTGIEYSEVRVS